jgi:muconolactone delta-isomerase
MRILALEVENLERMQKDIQPFLQEEARMVWKLAQSNSIREIYFHAENHTAVIMLEASGKEEAQQILDQLPLVREGFIHFDVIPLAPYDGYARLFR